MTGPDEYAILPSTEKMRSVIVTPDSEKSSTTGMPWRTVILQKLAADPSAGFRTPRTAVVKLQDAELHIPGNARLGVEEEKQVSANVT